MDANGKYIDDINVDDVMDFYHLLDKKHNFRGNSRKSDITLGVFQSDTLTSTQ